MKWIKKVVLYENKSIEIDVLELEESDFEDGAMFQNLELDKFIYRYLKSMVVDGQGAEYVPESVFSFY